MASENYSKKIKILTYVLVGIQFTCGIFQIDLIIAVLMIALMYDNDDIYTWERV